MSFQRPRIAKADGSQVPWSSPAHRVGNDALNQRMMISWMGLMAGPEIKDPSLPTSIATSTAKDLSTTEPAQQNQDIGLRNIEILAIHLFVIQFKVRANARDGRMARLNDPQSLVVIALSPVEITGRTHQTFEDF